jgi:putative peptidoglycan lipid II flippase
VAGGGADTRIYYLSPVTSSGEFRKTAGSAGLIGLAALGGAVIGFFLQLLVAYFFGASAQTDAYFMAASTSELLSKLLMGGSITAVFVPLFVERLTRGQRADAWRLALNLVHLTLTVFVIALLLIAFFTPAFVRFIAPGFDAATSAVTIQLIRVLLPAFLLLFIVELLTAILHAFNQFTLPALLRLIAPSMSIIAIALFVRPLGIYALALGSVLSAVVQVIILWWGIHRQGLAYRFVWQPRDPAIRRLLRLVYPFILSVGMTQLAGIVYRVLVSGLPSGSLAALKFAEKINQLLAIMFLASVTTVIYPALSAKASQRDYAGMRTTIGIAIRLVVLATIPITIGAIILRTPLISLLYERGSFDSHDAAATSIAFLFLVAGLTVNGISSILGHATLALQKTRAAVAVTAASQVLAIVLFLWLVPRMGHAGLALASSLVPLGITLCYFLYLARHIPRLYQIFIHASYLKIGTLALLLAATVTITWSYVRSLPLPPFPSLLLQLVIPMLLGAAVFVGGAYWWRLPEIEEIFAIIGSRFGRWRRREP